MLYEINSLEAKVRGVVARRAAERGIALTRGDDVAPLRRVAEALRDQAERNDAAFRRYLEFVLGYSVAGERGDH